MSSDDYDYEMDAAQSTYCATIAGQAVKDFKYDLLQKYLIETSSLLSTPRNMLDEAVRLRASSPTVAYLLAAISAEVCVKKLLLAPIIHGLIDQEYAASLVEKLVLGRQGLDRFCDPFMEILYKEGGIDLRTFKRQGENKNIIAELKEIGKIRNGIAHEGDVASDEAAAHALVVAHTLMDDIFPKILDRFNLRIKDGRVAIKSCRDTGVRSRSDHPTLVRHSSGTS